MNNAYFKDLHANTLNRFWINNPTIQELEESLAAGAVNCTTNPAYCAKLLQKEPEYFSGLVRRALEETTDIDSAARQVYSRAASRVIERFRPLYDDSEGACGYVTIQGDPRCDENAGAIIREALSSRKLGVNSMAKIPVIQPGIEAIEACVEENIPICATEVFALAQAVDACECYEAAARRTGNRPPFFVTHISGIFDEYLTKLAERTGIEASAELIAQAGVAVAKKQYALIKKRGYHAVLLGGGARGMHHFTELIGGEVHVTINWSTALEIMHSGVGIVDRLNQRGDETVIAALSERFEVFRKAFCEDGLKREEYASFGPVQLFRNSFLSEWYTLLTQVADMRHRFAL
jgi:transaldolase